MALISSLYSRGDESAAHYQTRAVPNWAGVPKNIRKPSKVKKISGFMHTLPSVPDVADPLMCLFK